MFYRCDKNVNVSGLTEMCSPVRTATTLRLMCVVTPQTLSGIWDLRTTLNMMRSGGVGPKEEKKGAARAGQTSLGRGGRYPGTGCSYLTCLLTLWRWVTSADADNIFCNIQVIPAWVTGRDVFLQWAGWNRRLIQFPSYVLWHLNNGHSLFSFISVFLKGSPDLIVITSARFSAPEGYCTMVWSIWVCFHVSTAQCRGR